MQNLDRIRGMNPYILVCALLLIDAGVEEEPQIIRERKEFSDLLDALNIRSSSSSVDVRDTRKASLILMEVFVYMILVARARSKNPRAIDKEDELI